MSKIQEKIDELQGTCDTLNIEDFTMEELEIIDSQIFCCESCDWWCEISEVHPNGTCNDCNE